MMNATPELLSRASATPVRTLSTGQGPDMVADLWDPIGDPLGTVVLLHGGFWRAHIDRQHLSHMAKALAEDGWQAISLEYPRAAGDPDLTHQSVKSALTELLQTTHLTAAPTVLLGHSAGGQLALWAASTHQFEFTSLIALAPVTSLQQAEELGLGEGAVLSFLGRSAATRPDLDPEHLLTPTTPTLLIHGGQDSRVPIAMSRNYAQDRPDVSLHSIEGADHFDLIDPQSIHWPAVREALRQARLSQ
ncbi:alpha/beta hydrolase [Nesterenkonia natronophila]|uniref:Alpha/beta hydrolase n=1 Tax=Nesterenkonia natronophila TaxID=2174932 RepID=A0A3A4FCG1_9MICC|nr:alpha/beta hydrolase [Nesterenkonia natronophila]RJN32444.1 alpha/beta hydrolase [Nesterenkonia natronophila]